MDPDQIAGPSRQRLGSLWPGDITPDAQNEEMGPQQDTVRSPDAGRSRAVTHGGTNSAHVAANDCFTTRPFVWNLNKIK